MNRTVLGGTALAVLGAATAGYIALGSMGFAQGSLQTPAVDIAVSDSFEDAATDAKTQAIVAAANAFLATLSDEERALTVYDLTDNTQRANWSNFPTGPVQRGGVMRGNLTDDQNAAMDALLAEVMSADGYNNIKYQLAAEETLDRGTSGRALFGDEYYFLSFVGTPSETQPWMLQFGGHHLAINVTFYGGDATFSPMLTGGEPLKIDYDGDQVFITEKELTAAAAFMNSLSDDQLTTAIRGSKAIQLLTGPGEYGVVPANEGIKGSDLSDAQQALLLDVIAARLGFINDDDFAANMAPIRATLDDTYFGWWGPEAPMGAAYFRITGPNLILEYSPQDLDGDPTDHAHNMYRDPTNDYGAAWLAGQ